MRIDFKDWNRAYKIVYHN